jgi:hypothetical protein
VPELVDQTFFFPRPEIAAREINDGAVLVDMKSGGCFELNRIGFEIWQLLQQKRSFATICDSLCARYPVQREVLASDVESLIESLVRAGLVEKTVPR